MASRRAAAPPARPVGAFTRTAVTAPASCRGPLPPINLTARDHRPCPHGSRDRVIEPLQSPVARPWRGRRWRMCGMWLPRRHGAQPPGPGSRGDRHRLRLQRVLPPSRYFATHPNTVDRCSRSAPPHPPDRRHLRSAPPRAVAAPPALGDPASDRRCRAHSIVSDHKIKSFYFRTF
jgi:hypothetical protein